MAVEFALDTGPHRATMGVLDTDSGYNSRQISPEEQQVYNYFLRLVEETSPEESIHHFRRLLIEGAGCQDREVTQAVERLIRYGSAETDFVFLLNRCCHILINRWHLNLRSTGAIPDLIRQFESLPSPYGMAGARSRSAHRLRGLVKGFTASEQYLTLQRLLQVVEQAAEGQDLEGERPLGGLIHRYPYLYEHYLLDESSTNEQQLTIQRLQAQHQRRFELDLSQYVLYQVRCARASRQGPEQLTQLQKRMQSVSNPTLLTNPDLATAVKHFTGKIEAGKTYRDLARTFKAHSTYGPTYGQFKRDLYQYLVSSVEPGYGSRRFNPQLCNYLQRTFADLDQKPLSDFLMVRTCGQLLNFLVVESSNRIEHFTFVDLIGNLGATLTTGLLLKILLLCSKVKPHLEKRLAILFNHYEGATRHSVQWLVQILENLNVAFSTNFGNANLTLVV